MEIRVAIFCVISQVILSTDPKSNTSEYLGCHKRRDDYEKFGWETSLYNVDLTIAVFIKECQSEARVKGWKAFIVNENRVKLCESCNSTCLGSHSPSELLEETVASFDCVSWWLDGQWLVSGGNEGMPTYQIVEHHVAQFTEDQDPSITCTPQTIHIFEALLFKPGPSCLGKEIVNVTTTMNSTCSGTNQCDIHNYDYNVGGCSYESLNITYGCLYNKPLTVEAAAANLAVELIRNIRYIIFALVVIIVPITCWCRRKSYLHRYPKLRCCCWKLHQSCPCLDLYPSNATDPHSMFGGQGQVNVQPPSMSGGVYPPPAPGGTFPPPAYGGANPPGDGLPPPYNPSAAPTEGANLPPPPSYTEANTSGGRTSGGWFAKFGR